MLLLLLLLLHQVHELTNALTLARSDLSSAESEVARLKELHSQVKAALQESYSKQQEQRKQVCLSFCAYVCVWEGGVGGLQHATGAAQAGVFFWVWVWVLLGGGAAEEPQHAPGAVQADFFVWLSVCVCGGAERLRRGGCRRATASSRRNASRCVCLCLWVWVPGEGGGDCRRATASSRSSASRGVFFVVVWG